MSIENLKRISEAEAEAVSIRKQAQADVRDIAKNGRKEAQELIGRVKQSAEARYRKALAKAQAEADEAYDARLREVAAECEATKSSAAARLPDAVKVITGKVVNSSVYC